MKQHTSKVDKLQQTTMISGHEQCCQIGIPWAVAQQKMPEEPQEDATPRTMREKPRDEERQ